MRQVIKKERVRGVGASAPRPPAKDVPADACAAAPSVRAIRLDGRVRALEVTCPCGTVSLVELEYESAPPPGASGEEK